MKITFSNIKISAKNKIDDKLLVRNLCGKVKISENNITDLFILKKSLDARKKPDLYYIFSVVADIKDNKTASRILKDKKNDAALYEPVKYNFPLKTTNIDINDNNRPVIVGMGPAGLFAAYSLSRAGFKPLIIERGKKVEDRIADVDKFWSTGELNENSNIQFGEGGAGTFSDGKLNTGVKDKYGRITEVLDIFINNGASKEIAYASKPHIGTDVLTEVVKNMRNYILAEGGNILYSTKFVRPVIENDVLTGVVIAQNGVESVIKCKNLILATGHSSRHTYREIAKSGLDMCSKPFAIGLRVQHSQDMINKSQYGEGYESMYNGLLPASDYKVTYNNDKGLGVYSFCMCPGGYVVNASSEKNRLAVNGMSYQARDSKNANSAIVVTVDSSIYGNELFSGMLLQEQIEEKAFKAGNGKVPVQNFKDYQEDKASTEFYSIMPEIKGQYILSNNRHILPDILEESIIDAMHYYASKIKGFDEPGTLLCGVESRTSSPVKILRDNDTLMSNIKYIFPCGEGAGYAGGITSAAVDGLKVAEKVALLYNQGDFD